MLCQVKALGSSWVIVVLSCWKNRNFVLTKIILINHRKVLFPWFALQKINIQITQVLLVFQNFLSSRSFRKVRLLQTVLFWWLYGFLWWVFAIEKLEYSRYNKKQNKNWFDTALIVVVCFLILTGLTKVLLSFVWLKFSSFGLSYDGWRKDVRA